MDLIHTCYRVTDPERSIAFYEALGSFVRNPDSWLQRLS